MTSRSEQIKKQLEAAKQAYYASLPERLRRIEHCCGQLQTGNGENYQELYHLLHTLAGSAETFGLPELTAIARQLVEEMKQWQHQRPSQSKLTVFFEHIDKLKALINGIAETR